MFRLYAVSLTLIAQVNCREIVRKVLKDVATDSAEQSNGQISLRPKCLTQHPVHRDDIADMTATEILECYAIWHDATLAAWRKEPNKCEGRYARVLNADHGLGDSGGAFVGVFLDHMLRGEMLFWNFKSGMGMPTVWEVAMVQPFQWDLRDSKHLFCLDDDALKTFGLTLGSKVVKCPTCPDPNISPVEIFKLPGHKVFRDNVKTLWAFLYRPKPDVQQVVQSVLTKVKKEETLVGVHFRAQWFGAHRDCGCLDSWQAPQCLANMGKVLQQREIVGFEPGSRLRYFVASDEFQGVDAFRETFGEDVITLPDTLPLEHSLNVSDAGAKRIFAEFLILQKAKAILGTCGSTFTQRVVDASGLPANATIVTGTPEAHACAAGNTSPHDFKAFEFARFANKGVTWSAKCGCYGEDEHARGAERQRVPKAGAPIRGTICEGKSLMQADHAHKPQWISQKRG